MQQGEQETKAEEQCDSTGPAVYRAINKVQSALAKAGIGKENRNKEQGYSYRGIDDVYNSLAPLLAEAGLCILPRIKSRHQDVRQTNAGKPLFSVVVEADFDFVASTDGTKHTVTAFGEAMDTADKATNKAMSAAYKYACLQTFCIPTEGDNDADAATPVVTSARAPVFATPEDREIFLGNVKASFDSADTLAKVKELAALNQPKLDELWQTGLPEDKDAVDKVVQMHRDAVTRLKNSVLNPPTNTPQTKGEAA